MSSSPRSLTAEEQVPSWRFFLPGGLHICGPLIASILACLSARVCMCRKAGASEECSLFAEYWPWFPMTSCSAPRLPLAGFNHSEVTVLSFSAFHSLLPKSSDSDFVDKDWCRLPSTGLLWVRAFMREWVNDQVQSIAYMPRSDLALLTPYSMS